MRRNRRIVSLLLLTSGLTHAAIDEGGIIHAAVHVPLNQYRKPDRTERVTRRRRDT
jgi:hypothetical protein